MDGPVKDIWGDTFVIKGSPDYRWCFFLGETRWMSATAPNAFHRLMQSWFLGIRWRRLR